MWVCVCVMVLWAPCLHKRVGEHFEVNVFAYVFHFILVESWLAESARSVLGLSLSVRVCGTVQSLSNPLEDFTTTNLCVQTQVQTYDLSTLPLSGELRTWARAECLLFTPPGSLNVCVRVKEICVSVWELMCVCPSMPETHMPLSASHPHVFICGREIVTRSVKWWLPSDNKQRDLLSMTEHSRTWFQSVTEDTFKLPQSPRCLS